jgi:hypothetical protein
VHATLGIVAAEGTLPQESRVEILRDRLLVHVGGKVSDMTVRRLAETAGGLVFRGKSGREHMLRIAPSLEVPCLFDPSLYESTWGATEPDVNLFGADGRIDEQIGLGAGALLSPSGAVREGDQDSLREVLEAGMTFVETCQETAPGRPVFVVVPVSSAWLLGGDLEVLISALRDASVPVALVLGHRMDPLSPKGAVAGLIRLVSELPEVLLLRSDLAGAIGALANGALAGTIGTNTSVRHFVLPDSSGGGSPDESPSVLVRGANMFKKGSHLERLRSREGLLNCPCSVDEGRPVSRYGDPLSTPDAMVHNLWCANEVAARVLAYDVELRPEAWRMIVDQSMTFARQLADVTKAEWSSPGLTAWSSPPPGYR